jgi:hypothetical protein
MTKRTDMYGKSDVPGPGNYSTDADNLYGKSPAFSFGNKHHDATNSVPGPGEYDAVNPKSGK